MVRLLAISLIALAIFYGFGEYLLQSAWHSSLIRRAMYFVFFFYINYIFATKYCNLKIILSAILSICLSVIVVFLLEIRWIGLVILMIYFYASLLADRKVKGNLISEAR